MTSKKCEKVKMPFWPIWGIFGLFKAHRDAVSVPKKVNDKVSCDGIRKFEIGTMKTHYKDIHNDILEKHQKKPRKGVFLALKEPPGHTQELSRSTDKQNYVASN